MKRLLFLLLSLLGCCSLSAQSWIWYPGDWEIWLGNKMNNRRTERGAFFPPFWKIDSHYTVVEFSRDIDLAEDETVDITVEGVYNIKLDGKLQFGMPTKFTLPAGRHTLCIKVSNLSSPPALLVRGKTVVTDSSWRVTNEDKEWIDSSGKASDTSATDYRRADCSGFDDPTVPPSSFRLSTSPLDWVSSEPIDGGTLYDFGRETFGYLQFDGMGGEGSIDIYYGESREEALDKLHCETLDRLVVRNSVVTDAALARSEELGATYVMHNSKALRYAFAVCNGAAKFDRLRLQYEYMPLEYKGSFRSSDEELNRIWQTAAYTLHITSREFFVDGIKRDRWVWSGDAVQSYLMNYYLFNSNDLVKRTTWLLGGKDPVTSHINTIMDYTFYWFIGIYDYYMYSGDRDFLVDIYPRMQSLMNYVLGRTNSEGMVEGQTGDWVFVDWADGPMNKHGELSIEQILLCRSLETMALCARLADDKSGEELYSERATALRGKLIDRFWDDERGALVHNRLNGQRSEQITRYANMFAVFFGYLDDDRCRSVSQNVLHNDAVMQITTPYMRFYELEALCRMGEKESVMSEMKSYWGGMLREGATTFWEKYVPTESGTQHLSMYGRPYGKSLCHAWGASPLYLLGRYYLGVQPTSPGYQTYSVEPDLGGLEWLEGEVPTPFGVVKVSIDRKQITVSSDGGQGVLRFRSAKSFKRSEGRVKSVGDNLYEVEIPVGEQLTIKYQAL